MVASLTPYRVRFCRRCGFNTLHSPAAEPSDKPSAKPAILSFVAGLASIRCLFPFVFVGLIFAAVLFFAVDRAGLCDSPAVSVR